MTNSSSGWTRRTPSATGLISFDSQNLLPVPIATRTRGLLLRRSFHAWVNVLLPWKPSRRPDTNEFIAENQAIYAHLGYRATDRRTEDGCDRIYLPSVTRRLTSLYSRITRRRASGIDGQVWRVTTWPAKAGSHPIAYSGTAPGSRVQRQYTAR
jgi:hypothetical protein